MFLNCREVLHPWLSIDGKLNIRFITKQTIRTNETIPTGQQNCWEVVERVLKMSGSCCSLRYIWKAAKGEPKWGVWGSANLAPGENDFKTSCISYIRKMAAGVLSAGWTWIVQRRVSKKEDFKPALVHLEHNKALTYYQSLCTEPPSYCQYCGVRRQNGGIAWDESSALALRIERTTLWILRYSQIGAFAFFQWTNEARPCLIGSSWNGAKVICIVTQFGYYDHSFCTWQPWPCFLQSFALDVVHHEIELVPSCTSIGLVGIGMVICWATNFIFRISPAVTFEPSLTTRPFRRNL